MKKKKHNSKCVALEKTELIGLEAIQDLVELTLWSTYIKGEKIVSLMLVADPESGKTELMKKYRKNRGIHVRRRFTAYGVIRDLTDGKMSLLFERPKILGHILVYDFANIYTFKANTVDSTIEFLDALTEDGLSPESAYWVKGKRLEPYKNLKGGIIAGINTFGFFTSYGKVKANLYKGGWFSRNIVATFALSQTMTSQIFNSIARGEYRYDRNYVKSIRLNFPEHRVQVCLPENHSREIRNTASEIAEEYSDDLAPHRLKGFRLHKSLISLTKASALRDGRKTVKKKDVERITYLSQWMNLKMRMLRVTYPFGQEHARKHPHVVKKLQER